MDIIFITAGISLLFIPFVLDIRRKWLKRRTNKRYDKAVKHAAEKYLKKLNT